MWRLVGASLAAVLIYPRSCWWRAGHAQVGHGHARFRAAFPSIRSIVATHSMRSSTSLFQPRDGRRFWRFILFVHVRAVVCVDMNKARFPCAYSRHWRRWCRAWLCC